MKMIRIIGETMFRRVNETERINIEIKLMWIPGIKPVIVPAVIPSNNARIISINILL